MPEPKDAKEVKPLTSGSEQIQTTELDDGFEAGLNAQIDDELSVDKKPVVKAIEKKEEKVVTELDPVVEKKAEPVAEKTAVDKAEEAAKSIANEVKVADTKPSTEAKSDVLQLLGNDYAWAKSDRENGKLLEFVKTQPKAIQKMAGSTDVDDAKYVLDSYKAWLDQKIQPAKENQAVNEVKAYVKRFGDKTFMGSDGTQKKLSDIVEGYGDPDLFEVIGMIADSVVGDRKQPEVAKAGTDERDSRIQRLEQDAADREFWDSVIDAHPDARKLQKSGKISEWAKTQSEGIQRLLNSSEPDHAILVLDAYKESIAKEQANNSIDSSKEKKKNLDGLYGETIKGGRDVRAPKGKSGDLSPEEEVNAGFEEGLK